MGAICSICRRRHYTVTDVEGGTINIEDEFEAFEDSHLLNKHIIKSDDYHLEGDEGYFGEHDTSPILNNKPNTPINLHTRFKYVVNK